LEVDVWYGYILVVRTIRFGYSLVIDQNWIDWSNM
jgi:hypothetical protein